MAPRGELVLGLRQDGHGGSALVPALVAVGELVDVQDAVVVAVQGVEVPRVAALRAVLGHVEDAVAIGVPRAELVLLRVEERSPASNGQYAQ